ncbi:MAG: hypothetical protein Q4C65_02355 [Eubacteriales bacterium]|nr:hypothetical protein [Eubacteriales bacterium]
MDTPITRAEHEEFRRRIDEENKRQNKRIELVEEQMKRSEALSMSIKKLAINMENMLKEQKHQGARLEILESRDGEMWRNIVKYTLTTILGILIGFVLRQIGF